MKNLCVYALLFLGLAIPSCLYSQSTSATLSGLVTDPSGRTIPGAQVEIVNDATGIRYAAETNEAGIYSVSILPPGRYHLQVAKIGFKTIIKPDIVLNVQSAMAINFTLPVGAMSETITVRAGSSLLNTTDGSVSTVIGRKFVQNVPLNGRSFQDLILMAPGVVTQSPQAGSSVSLEGDFSVNGQRTESNYYTVDGVSANTNAGNGFGVTQAGMSGSLPATTALGTTQSLISVDALQEFRVDSSSYSAEYGRTPGGQFALVTRSGTNVIHGTAFDYLRNNFFDANDWFNDHYKKPNAALRQNDFGFTLGGPVFLPHVYDGKDKTFFFASYEGLRLTQPQAASIEYVPDAALRASAAPALQPLMHAFPLPTPGAIDLGELAQFIKPYSIPSQIDATSIRMDHTFSSRRSAFFRFGFTPSSSESRDLSAVDRTLIGSQTYTFGTTEQFSSQATNEFRIGYVRSDAVVSGVIDSFGGATPSNFMSTMAAGSYRSPEAIAILYFPGSGISQLGTPNASDRGRQWNLVDNFSLSTGHHQLKFGIDYRHISSPTTPPSPTVLAEFTSVSQLQNNSAAEVALESSISSTPVFNETAAFAEDEWKAVPNLSLSFGVRWEVDPPPTEANGKNPYTLLGSLSEPASLTLAPRGTPLWKTTWYNFAPRIGAAWTARTAPGWETILRGGGGVFFDTDNELAVQGLSGIGFRSTQYLFGGSLPVSSTQLAFSPSVEKPYTNAYVYAFPAHLQLPYTLEWNVSVEQGLGNQQAATISYVGANGRRLLQDQILYLTPLNANFGYVYYLANNVSSNYQALQLQYQRSVSRGLNALASYTWSHSIDFGSNNTALPLTRGNSDFDVRNNLQAGLSWDAPYFSRDTLTRVAFSHWGVDARFIARTAFPVTLQGNFIIDPATGQADYGNVNLVPNQPTYLFGNEYPGGREVNPAAFAIPSGGGTGDAPRNFVRGFGARQLNLALRREFPLHDDLSLQFRAETFNLFNHPNFGYIDPVLGDAIFGQSTKMLNQSLGTVASQYQQGGPRSMQFALKLIF